MFFRVTFMQTFDLNLLVTLDALLDEGSIVGAAERLRLSPSAVSRALGRIREMVGEPVFVRAGRGIVPTPKAEELRPQIKALLDEAKRMLTPAAVDPARLERTFCIRAMDSVAATVGALLAVRVRDQAPKVMLRFVGQGDESIDPLRNAQIDFDIGIFDKAGPEIRRQTLYREPMVGVVRAGHPMLPVLSQVQSNFPAPDIHAFASFPHVAVSRRGTPRGPVDHALAERMLTRTITLVVPHANAALIAAAATDLIAVVGLSLARHTKALGLSIEIFELPVPVSDVPISLAWHPRLDADPEHRWLREHLRMILLEPAFRSAGTK